MKATIRALAKRLDEYRPKCGHRGIVTYREGAPEPTLGPPCDICGDSGCGFVVICEQTIVGKEPDGTLITEAGTRIPPERDE